MPNSQAAPQFFRVKVTGIKRKNEDDFTSMCFELGADGVAEDLAFVQKDLRYDPEILETPEFNANVYFAALPSEDQLLKIQSQLQNEFPEARFELLFEENRDWLAEWKKGFKPFLFAAPFWVIPSWLKAPPEAPQDPRFQILIEPGMAFGTGTHETTRLAAGLIIEEMKRNLPQSLLDVGTGTAILALIAHRLGVKKVVGNDIDPEARRTARENLELNRAPEIEITDLSIEEIKEQYDVVVANIIDGVLLILKEDLNRALRPGGRMILSGVLMDREAEFYETFTQATGLKLLKKVSEGEWSAALLEKSLS